MLRTDQRDQQTDPSVLELAVAQFGGLRVARSPPNFEVEGYWEA